MENQLGQVLFNANNPTDQNVRTEAAKWLKEAEKSNYPYFIQLLVHELGNNERPLEVRQTAGIVFKNTLTAKDNAQKIQNYTRWLQVEPNVRDQIKNMLLTALSASHKEVRLTVAVCISTIAHIELPRNQWADLMGVLVANMDRQTQNTQQDNDVKQSSLDTIGYICEEIDALVLAGQANQILTAVCKGIVSPVPEVKLAGCNALFNALEFARTNFDNESERNYIMQVLCEAASTNDVNVRVSAFGCIVKIATLYYDHLQKYMQRLFVLTLEAIKKDDEKVAQQGVEFWSSICDEELYLMEEAEEAQELKVQPSRFSQNFIRGALKFLVPILTECLTRQDEDPDEDTWNVAMASGTCLSLVAQVSGDEVVPHVMPFIQQHINNENWKFREAATLAFGAILEGPKSFIGPLVQQAIPILLDHMKDPVVYVKDTTAWTLGRICQLHTQTIDGILPRLITVLLESIGDTPRVAANICWTIHNISMAYEEDSDKNTSQLSPYFNALLEKLLQTCERDDSDEHKLRSSAYEAVNMLMQAGARDTVNTVLTATPMFIARLEKTFSMQILSKDDKDEQTELQSLLCGSLMTITQKLGPEVKQFADRLMTLYLQVFGSKSASVHEEALMAVGALANVVEGDFEKYMPHFRQFLCTGLRNYEEHQVCAIAVGVVGDISRALLTKLTPYCDEIVTLLLGDLQNAQMNRSVKPPILSCFGDIALAIGGEFVKYLGVVMNMLQQASLTKVDTGDADLLDYLNQLRESIFEAYTGIILGLRSDNAADPHLLPYVNNIVQFCSSVYNDNTRTETVTRGALGVIGDLAQALGSKVKQYLTLPFVKQLINECFKADPQTRDVAQWVKDMIQAL